MQIICDDFPQFLGWPSRKVYFLENMSCGQVRHQGPSYFIITKETDDRINHTCEICKQRLAMAFNEEEEEWVFNDAKEVNGIVYHYPLCYEAIIEKKG